MLKINKDIMMLDITYKCDINCLNCDRHCSYIKPKQMDITQIYKFYHDTKRLKRIWQRIEIMGGEPSLHPNIYEIIDLIEKLRNDGFVSEYIALHTNGRSEKAREIIKIAEEFNWIVYNSNKIEGKVFAFNPPMIASNDLNCFDHENNECEIPLGCGTGLNYKGYYVCLPAAAIDEIFGLNLAIEKIEDVTEERYQEQAKKLCRYCGHYLFYKKVTQTCILDFEPISYSWREALIKYGIDING